jgi:hypothetical protein
MRKTVGSSRPGHKLTPNSPSVAAYIGENIRRSTLSEKFKIKNFRQDPSRRFSPPLEDSALNSSCDSRRSFWVPYFEISSESVGNDSLLTSNVLFPNDAGVVGKSSGRYANDDLQFRPNSLSDILETYAKIKIKQRTLR